MRYFGGKQRISTRLAGFFNDRLKNGQAYVEPFCGSCNVISKIDNNRPRFANDKHKYVVAMWKALQNGWQPPESVTRKDYNFIKENKDTEDIPDALAGFVGFGMSFGGKWFGVFTGEVSKNGQDYLKCAKNGAFKKLKGVSDVSFTNMDFEDIVVENPNSLIYCDIPYKNTTPYYRKEVGAFDYEAFYEWARKKTSEGHDVYVSEYIVNVPEDAYVVWSVESGTTNAAWQGSAKKTTEVLFTFNKDLQV